MSGRMIERYIDIEWYRAVYGITFRTVSEAATYYLAEGEKKGHFPNPIFDPMYYRAGASLNTDQSSLEHYVAAGASAVWRPCRYFDAEWYQWQNPDVAEFGSSVLHYLSVGGREYRDPCPEVDMVALSREYGYLGDGCVLTHLLSTGHIETLGSFSVTNEDADLVSRQRKFLQTIEPQLIRSCQTPTKGRNLLVVQCAKDSEFWGWFDPDRGRDWDLFLNCYAGNFEETAVAEYVCLQPGTKFTGMLKCWLHFESILGRYDYVFFVDDDLVFRFDDVSRFFGLMKSYGLDLAQPSLTSTSQCAWQVFYNVQRRGVRRTNGVEIMMPALSRRAIELLIPYFAYSVSGFGLDLLMAKLAARSGLSVGVIDDIVVCHEKKIDQSGGAYYEFLRARGINSKYELWRMIKVFRLERVLHEV